MSIYARRAGRQSSPGLPPRFFWLFAARRDAVEHCAPAERQRADFPGGAWKRRRTQRSVGVPGGLVARAGGTSGDGLGAVSNSSGSSTQVIRYSARALGP